MPRLMHFVCGLILPLSVVLACTPTPAPPMPPPGPDASDSGVPSAPDAGHIDAAPPPPQTPCGKACANLAALGCADGTAPNCAAVCEHVVASRIAPIDPAKLAAAKTKADARAAGARCR